MLRQLKFLTKNRCVSAAAGPASVEVTQINLPRVQVLRVSSRLSSPQLCGPAGLHLSPAAVTVLQIKRRGVRDGCRPADQQLVFPVFPQLCFQVRVLKSCPLAKPLSDAAKNENQ